MNCQSRLIRNHLLTINQFSIMKISKLFLFAFWAGFAGIHTGCKQSEPVPNPSPSVGTASSPSSQTTVTEAVKSLQGTYFTGIAYKWGVYNTVNDPQIQMDGDALLDAPMPGMKSSYQLIITSKGEDSVKIVLSGDGIMGQINKDMGTFKPTLITPTAQQNAAREEQYELKGKSKFSIYRYKDQNKTRFYTSKMDFYNSVTYLGYVVFKRVSDEVITSPGSTTLSALNQLESYAIPAQYLQGDYMTVYALTYQPFGEEGDPNRDFPLSGMKSTYTMRVRAKGVDSVMVSVTGNGLLGPLTINYGTFKINSNHSYSIWSLMGKQNLFTIYRTTGTDKTLYYTPEIKIAEKGASGTLVFKRVSNGVAH